MTNDNFEDCSSYEKECYSRLSSKEKLTFVLTFAFDYLLHAFYIDWPPFCKIDIAFADSNSISLYSYNNGIEINYYVLYVDPDGGLRDQFLYVPGVEDPPRNCTLASHFCLDDKRKMKTKLNHFFDMRAQDILEDYPCDPLAKVQYIGSYENMQLYAAPIGFGLHIRKSSQFILQNLFTIFINKVKSILPGIKKTLSNSNYREVAASLLDHRSILMETWESSLIRLVYGKSYFGNNEYLFDIICNIASLPYEHRANTGMLIFANNQLLSSNKLVRFEKQLRISMRNAREIRKLLEMSKGDVALLVNNGLILGMIERPNSKSINGIQFRSAGNWELLIHNEPVLIFFENRCFLTRKSDESDLHTLLIANFPNCLQAENVLQIIKYAEQQKHGTAMIISDNVVPEVDRLCELHRGIKIQPLRLLDHPNLIGALTSIDGAIIVDTAGYCYAIGVILDGDAVIEGSTARGARFNSVKNYIERQKERMNSANYIGVIVSEDDSVDFLATKNNALTNS